jgi:hypothetical protein
MRIGEPISFVQGRLFREDGMSQVTKNDAEEFAHTTNAVTYILSAAGCPTKFRDYIDCLIGIAEGKTDFIATDKQITSKRKVAKTTDPNATNKDWARDKRRDLLKWQKENELYFLDYKEGIYNKKVNRKGPSHFRLHLVDYVQQVVAEAKKKKFLWKINPTTAIQQAAQEFINVLRTQPVKEQETNFLDPRTEVLRKMNGAKTMLENAKQLLEKYNFELSKDDELLVTSLEQILKKIKDRGFVDLWDMKIFSGIEKEEKP